MSREMDEMMVELAATLGALEKTAAKKEKDEDEKEVEMKEEKADKKDKKKDEKKEDKKDKKEDKPKKKAAVLMGLIGDLQKIANELDVLGDEESASAVDDALRVILENIK